MGDTRCVACIRRRRGWPLALSLALIVVGVASPVGADVSAQRDEQPTINYSVSATRPRRVCVGSDTTITVSVTRRVSAPDAAPELLNAGLTAAQRDVVIDAKIEDRQILSADHAFEITGLDGSQPPSATFTFHAKKQGVTTVDFTAKIAAMGDTDGWKGVLEDKTVPVEVTVTNCKFAVSVASVWRVPGPANLAIGARIIGAQLEPDAAGEYRTLASITWYFAASQVGDCVGSLSASGSTDAAIFATLDQAGVLTVDVKYDPVVASITITCRGVPGHVDQTLQASDLQFLVPSTGGHGRLAQDLSGTPGAAAYVVEPLDESEQ